MCTRQPGFVLVAMTLNMGVSMWGTVGKTSTLGGLLSLSC